MAIYRGAGGAGDATNDATSHSILAAQSAQEAAASEAAAASSASSAATSASAASTSATNAASSATFVAASATNAANSATSATTQASNAASSASAAATSASNAATSETNAANSASAAATSATNASNSASSASTSATNASNSASAAATSATNAAASAIDAQSSEDAAAAYASSINPANFLAKANNLSDLSNTSTARTNLGLGTAATMMGPTSTIVGTADTQTLTNKTLTSPIINGTGVTFNDGSSQQTAASGFGFKNRIINGAMMIDQRNAGASGTAGGYTVDRWYWVISQASKGTWQQNAGSVTPPVGFKNYWGFTSSSAYSVNSTDYFLLFQPIEGLNTYDFAWGTAGAKNVVLSFQVYSSLTGTFTGSLKNADNTRSYPFTYTVSAANTWTTVSVSIPGDTSGTWLTTNATGVVVMFGLGSGSSRLTSAGTTWRAGDYDGVTGSVSVVGTNGATFYVTGVQLEKGSTATSFDYRPYGTELALCQRYYEKLGEVSYAGIANGLINSVRTGTNTVIKPIVQMRSGPTINYSNIVSTDRASYDATITGMAGTASSPNSIYLLFSHAASGSAQYPSIIAVANGTTGYISLEAEL